jgi:hypothetical protein
VRISAKILESDKQVRTLILNSLLSEVNKTIQKSLPIINLSIQKIVAKALRDEPEYLSLKTGTLRYELGIANPNSIDELVQALVETGQIDNKNTKITNYGISGGFVYKMIGKQDLQAITLSSNARVIDLQRQYSLPWLEWLLFEGSSPIVKNYEVVLEPSTYSRTGGALMKRSNTNWRVPPQYAGTITNNWITRALSTCEKQVVAIIQSTIKSNI